MSEKNHEVLVDTTVGRRARPVHTLISNAMIYRLYKNKDYILARKRIEVREEDRRKMRKNPSLQFLLIVSPEKVICLCLVLNQNIWGLLTHSCIFQVKKKFFC